MERMRRSARRWRYLTNAGAALISVVLSATATSSTITIFSAIGLAAVVLVVCQPVLFGHFCTLCLASAACSLLGCAAAAPEVWATVQHLRRERQRGFSWGQALRGERTPTQPQSVS